ncbi:MULTISPECIES: GNAT family N-acetyltransferase [unclassified Mesorhizobium]|uniref:GNAT family N-acetyltransferase n=1 Tax=unclassified Mesorhizobium TaxID=325217 RepID=UPI000FCA783C|nr:MULTISPECIES: GNAT family N-acetyltransferase [unclassified Mesorhizobium]RUW69023.1 GNAT family N-acetyltransferase [Mesorhizobium sp. M4B.F.Ca.ET.049.02.1.2]RVD20173.1 GNAT family N-acetyltransferase [Mesorhizobium sp. M4B.F.Ca.ET.017.02.2.1]TGV23568.1 GNAT family N-acetyltransferase [Mesorhizobium sp. M4B.F.Ca.ET.143.01.1.1]
MVDLLVTYMEMTEPPSGAAFSAPTAGATVEREALDIASYFSLYRAVGEAVQWDQRLRMKAADLERLLASPATHVHVLRVDSEAAGLCEFNSVGQSVVELTHFGLVPAFQGRGLGPFLLDRSLRAIWSYRPERLWLHTDTYDHPNAQPVYRRAGFRPYAQRIETFPD